MKYLIKIVYRDGSETLVYSGNNQDFAEATYRYCLFLPEARDGVFTVVNSWGYAP